MMIWITPFLSKTIKDGNKEGKSLVYDFKILFRFLIFRGVKMWLHLKRFNFLIQIDVNVLN